MNDAENNSRKIEIPEITLHYNWEVAKGFKQVNTPEDLAVALRSFFASGEIQMNESMFVIYLNNNFYPIGYYRHSTGGIDATSVDRRIILAAALKGLATAMVICHNHPSGNLIPSPADLNTTKQLKVAAKLLGIHLLDHIIVTRDGFYSFEVQGLMGHTSSPYPIIPIETELIRQNHSSAESQKTNSAVQEKKYVEAVVLSLANKEKKSRTDLEKLAKSFSIADKTKIKELTELAIVKVTRSIARGSGSFRERYTKIAAVYQQQANLSFRTSKSILLQQYSTPAPIAFLMGLFTEIHEPKSVFEPSAGNGLLTILSDPQNVIVNEVDPIRRKNLEAQDYQLVTAQDASQPFTEYQKKFDVVLTNPPFGTLDKPVMYGSFPIKELDHLMALIALDTMQDDGMAAIIIGGHTKWDEQGRIQKGKNRIFFNYLYSHYNVLDVIAIDGASLYSRQGTSFDTRLILIDSRKVIPYGAAPLRTDEAAHVVRSFDELYNRIMADETTKHENTNSLTDLELEALELEAELLAQTLDAPYVPASESCFTLETQVPDAMSFEMHEAVRKIKEEVGGDMDNFVRHRLGYPTKLKLCKALSAEQIDAVGLAIYNIEALNQSVIIGDQTGIGKGRVAAAVIRYAVQQGVTPIFLTEKANLFSDIYRDLKAIGSAHLVPFIVNARDAKTQVKDENGEVIYEALTTPEQKQVFESGAVPSRFDYVVATYSQFNSPEKKSEKPKWLNEIANGAIVIMDESHNASGSSNTGVYMQSVLEKARGAVFLSATFAKRPDNMPIYAMKTAISEANMTKEELVMAILKGGVALQEVLASQLVAEGQMIRRERTYEGVEVNYITLTELAQAHMSIADNITRIIRAIIAFQEKYVTTRVSEMDEIAAAEGEEVDLREGTNKAGVDNLPYFSKVFNIINQMLFSIKAEAVAERAIVRLKEGKKPLIAFSSTMGSFIEKMEDEAGEHVVEGDTVRADFAIVLEKGLEGVLRYTVIAPDGSKTYKLFDLTEFSIDAQNEYARIMREIRTVSTGITISPIDVIVQRIQKAGYSVAEVTGRKVRLQLNLETGMGLIKPRKRVNTNDAFRQFNDNEIDVLLINQSGSTGASAHAIVTDKVPADKVRQRVMIVLQPELDINTEVQKRGRIHRTGQILKPIYDYMNSAIPAEQRLMMMLQKKLKSLDANTSSNQKQSNDILDVPDFLNKYGDDVVVEYLKENPEINLLLGDPLGMAEDGDMPVKEGAAHKVSGRVAVLSTKMQEDFYREIKERYDTYVEYLRQTGDYDLEVEQLDLKAKMISKSVVKIGKGGFSSFGEDSILEKCEVNILKKPFKTTEVKNLIQDNLDGKTPDQIMNALVEEHEGIAANLLQLKINEVSDHYHDLIKEVPNEKKVQKLYEMGKAAHAQTLIQERIKELETAKLKRIDDEQIRSTNQNTFLRGLFKFFTIGRRIEYPVDFYEGAIANQLAIFTGFHIDRKKKNPFAPSAVLLKFAVASSQKFVAIPASYIKELNSIKGATFNIADNGLEATLKEWEQRITRNTKDRGIRHIVTGNLLQAFSDFKGKLVSFTTADEQVRKGILLPEYWELEKETDGKVIVPIAKAIRVIQSLTKGSVVEASGDIAFFKQNDEEYKVNVPASKKRGGDIYLHQGLLSLVERNIFEKVSDRMVATLHEKNLVGFTEILQNDLGITVALYQAQIDAVGLVETQSKRKIKIDLPPQESASEDEGDDMELLELEAEALELELELLLLSFK
ncbi:MAG: strawberry notch family protein [Bacteroidetes bacterium]|nr:strawberry notch family protein [Bacteroidota bacterium]